MNIKKIADYIRSGSKQDLKIGIEIEHFIVDSNHKSVSYYGNKGVGEILNSISQFFSEKFYSKGNLIALSNGNYHLTLEPAAQLEISIEPQDSIDKLKSYYSDFLDIINPVLTKLGYQLITMGYQPKSCVNDLELIPKDRYLFMDKYFENTGKYGKNMMRGTASTQVSIDYTNETDCITKFKLANILSPLFAMLCDNSAVFEGQKYNGRMLRTHIWDDLDDDRCGIFKFCTDKDFSLSKYAQTIYNLPSILIHNGSENIYTSNQKICDIYNSKEMSIEDIEHVLSMFFYDVRLKKYIEIRPADSMPIDFSLSYAAFIKGIFENCSLIYACINGDDISYSDIENAKSELINFGFDAKVYGQNAGKFLNFLAKISCKALPKSEQQYLNPILSLISKQTTLKDITERTDNND